MYRFFVDKKENDVFILNKNTLNHIKTIRLKRNELIICIYENHFYICEFIEELKVAKIKEKIDDNHECKNNVVLCASIIKNTNFEWLIQKATELGVKEFYPVICKNTNIKYLERFENKMERFKSIIQNAAEQSFRNDLMKIHKPIKFENVIELNIKNKIVAHEKISDNEDDQNILFDGDVCFFVGPEGGFDDKEIELAIKNNAKIISLGKRILRAETASLYLLSRIKN